MGKMKLLHEIVNSLRILADSIEEEFNVTAPSNETVSEEEEPTKQRPVNNKADSKQEARPKKRKPTLEELRAAMVEKNRGGHREEIKAILSKYGANNLTALDSRNYTKVMIEVEDIK